MNNSREQAKERSLRRWRAGLLMAAAVVPLALFTLFERQARRLDALAEHGKQVTAYVINATDRFTEYAYEVEGQRYTWNVAREEAPYVPGHVFSAVYLPADPSLSIPHGDASLAARAAQENRSFAWKVELGVALMLLVVAALAHGDLRRLHADVPVDPYDPQAYKARLVRTSLVWVPLVLCISGFHIKQALQEGESVLPGVITALLLLGFIGSAFVWAARVGPANAQTVALPFVRWAVSLAVAIAILRSFVELWTK